VDLELFQALLDTVREARRRRRALRDRGLRGGRRSSGDHAGAALDVRDVRALTKLSQARFAELLSIEVSTLRNWEQGRRLPTGPARALLRAIRANPVEVIRALNNE
jgi:putative transcriptional regulator